MEIRFDASDVIETERAKRVIKDMLKRGYALFVHTSDDSVARVKSFDATKDCYIIGDGPEVASDPSVPEERPRGRARARREVSMHEAKVTAVGRSAGG